MSEQKDRQAGGTLGDPSQAAGTELKFWRQPLEAAPLMPTPGNQGSVRAVTWQVWVSSSSWGLGEAATPFLSLGCLVSPGF